MLSIYESAIVPAPTAAQVVFHGPTVASASGQVDALGSDDAPSGYYRFYAIGAAASTSYGGVWLLFGRDGEVPALDPASVSGDTRPGLYVPPGLWVDVAIDQRNRFFRHASDDTDGSLLVVRVSL